MRRTGRARVGKRKYAKGFRLCGKANETPVKLCLADGWAEGREVGRARLAKYKYSKYFRLVLKSKGNARHFGNYVWTSENHTNKVSQYHNLIIS